MAWYRGGRPAARVFGAPRFPAAGTGREPGITPMTPGAGRGPMAPARGARDPAALRVLVPVLAVLLLGGACPIRVTITDPVAPHFTSAPAIDVYGRVERLPDGGSVLVAGREADLSAVALPPCPQPAAGVPIEPGEDGYFRACGVSVPGSGPGIEEIAAEVHVPGSSGSVMLARDLLPVVRGPAIPSQALLPEAVAARMVEGADGVDRIETALERILGGIDLYGAGLQNLDFTFAIGTQAYTVCATNAGFADLDTELDPEPGRVRADGSLHELFVDVNLWVGTLCPVTGTPLCQGTVRNPPGNPSSLTVPLAQEPLAAQPSQLDVHQAGPLDVLVGFLEYQPADPNDPCPGALVTSLLNALRPELEAALEGVLDDPDGWPGDGTCQDPADCPQDSPIAAAVEQTLAGIDLAGPVGGAVGLDLIGEFEVIDEGDTAVDYRFRTRFQTAAPVRVLPWILDVGDPGAGLPATRGDGTPYGFGLSVSPTALNQLLSATVEAGRMDLVLRELLPGVPLTVASLGDVAEIEAFYHCRQPPPDRSPICDHPIRIELRPTAAPVVLEANPPTPPVTLYDVALTGLRFDVIDEHPDAFGSRVMEFAIALRAPAAVDVVGHDALQLSLVASGVEVEFRVLDRGCCLVSDAGLAGLELLFEGLLPVILNGVIPPVRIPHVIGLGPTRVDVGVGPGDNHVKLLADLAYVPVVDDPGPQVAHAGQPWHLDLTAWHLDPTASLTFSVTYADGSPAPPGLTVVPSGPTTATVTWTPAPDQIGVHRLRAIATDQAGQSGSVDFDVQVCEAGQICNQS